MIKLLVPPGLPPFQISDFGKEVERTLKGALHFTPNSVRTISDSEWEWIQRTRPELAAKLRVLKLRKAAVPPPVADKPAPVVKTEEKVEKEEAESPEVKSDLESETEEKVPPRRKRRKKKSQWDG